MKLKLIYLFLFTAVCACKKNNTATSTVVKDADGNIYHTVDIGNQRWLVENLHTTHYNNGQPIRNLTDATAWSNASIDARNKQDSGAWCYYKNNADTGKIFGCLYNFYAVSDKRGIAPAGYRVADTTDYNTLINSLAGVAVAGSLLKDKTKGLPQSWQPPNTDASNILGFTALPGGFRSQDGRSMLLGTVAYFGTITINNYCFGLSNSYGGVRRFTDSETNGYSIRCLKDIN